MKRAFLIFLLACLSCEKNKNLPVNEYGRILIEKSEKFSNDKKMLLRLEPIEFNGDTLLKGETRKINISLENGEMLEELAKHENLDLSVQVKTGVRCWELIENNIHKNELINNHSANIYITGDKKTGTSLEKKQLSFQVTYHFENNTGNTYDTTLLTCYEYFVK